MTFIRGIALMALILTAPTVWLPSAWAQEAKCITIDAAWANIRQVAKDKGLRYVTTERPWPSRNGTVLFVIGENKSTHAWYYDSNGCLVAATGFFPAELLAREYFGKTLAELFPPEVGA